MRLLEDHYSMSHTTITKLFKTCLENFEQNICSLSDNEDFNFYFDSPFVSNSNFGITAFGYHANVAKFEAVVRLNGFLFKVMLKDSCINTIYHELCHVAAKKMLVEHGCYLKVQQHNGPQVAPGHEAEIEEESQNNKHGPLFQYFANKVNTILKPKMPIGYYATKEELLKFFEANEKTPAAYEAICLNHSCQKHVRFLTFDYGDKKAVLTAYIGMIEKMADKYTFFKCRACDAHMKMVFYDPTIEPFLKANEAKIVEYGEELGYLPLKDGGDN